MNIHELATKVHKLEQKVDKLAKWAEHLEQDEIVAQAYAGQTSDEYMINHGQGVYSPAPEELTDHERAEIAKSLFAILPHKMALRYQIERQLGINSY